MQTKKIPFKAVHVIYLMVSLIVGSACTSVGQSPEKENFGNIDVESAHQMIEQNKDNPDVVVLDTRALWEYNKSHIKGAEFFNYNAGDFWEKIKNLDTTKVYIVYCHSGNRSGNTVKFMKKNGFREAYNIRGGIVAWKRAGYQVVEE